MAILWLSNSDTVDPTGIYTDDAIHFASEILFKLSGEKYTGVQSTTEAYGSDIFSSVQLHPVVVYGDIQNVPLQTGLRNLRLRHTPILSVEQITTNGVLMDPLSYSIRNNAYLIRKNGIPWILDTISSLEISYTYGSPIPTAGKIAARRLANEYIYLMTDSTQCTLPQRITTSISRQGETISILDPLHFLDNGKTGVYEVDLFLQMANPNHAKKKPRVFSIDRPRGERIN